MSLTATDPSGRLGDPERVLEQRLGGVPVTVPEVEEPCADVGLDDEAAVGVRRHRPHGGGLGVGHPDAVAGGGGGEPGRLGEPRLARGPVDESLVGRARDDLDVTVLERGTGRPRPQAVGARHRDDEPAAEPGEVPRRRQRLLEGGAPAGAFAQARTGAGHDVDRPVGEADPLEPGG